MKPLVIVRPEPGATATARAAEEVGLETLVMPLFAVEPVPWRAPDPKEFDGLLVTSANAVANAGPELERLRRLPAYCVGDATAAAARSLGMTIGAVGTTGVDSLLYQVSPALRLLHLCGVDRREPASASQLIVALPVYRARELPIPEGFGAIDGAVVAVHSPRAGSVLGRRVDEAAIRRNVIALAAISEAAAEAAGAGWERVAVADAPRDSLLLAIAARLCKNPG